MIKAEVIEYPGAEVPNWVAKCKDILTSAPALGTITLAVLALVGVFFWHGRQPAFTNSTGVQSQPVSGSSLEVAPLTNAPLAQPVTTSPQASAASNSSVTSSGETVGPAPTSSLNSLQPSQSSQNNGQSLTQAATQNIQSAGKALKNGLQNLDL